jgi:hypothetical protein
MRKFILIAAIVLASATAQAGSSGNLTMAANDQPVAAEAPKAMDKAAAPKAEPAKPAAQKNVETPKVERPKRKRMSTEARVIDELHRHGIYR